MQCLWWLRDTHTICTTFCALVLLIWLFLQQSPSHTKNTLNYSAQVTVTLPKCLAILCMMRSLDLATGLKYAEEKHEPSFSFTGFGYVCFGTCHCGLVPFRYHGCSRETWQNICGACSSCSLKYQTKKNSLAMKSATYKVTHSNLSLQALFAAV